MLLLAKLSGDAWWSFHCPQCHARLKGAPVWTPTRLVHPVNDCVHSGKQWKKPDPPKITVETEEVVG